MLYKVGRAQRGGGGEEGTPEEQRQGKGSTFVLKRKKCKLRLGLEAYLLHLTLMKTYFKQLQPCQMSYFGSKLPPSKWEVSQDLEVHSNYKLIG